MIIYLIAVLILILVIFYTSYNKKTTEAVTSRTSRWKDSLPDKVSWWDNVKKSGESIVLGTV